jgi:hypothetical protein
MPTLERRVQVILHSPGTVPRVIFDSRVGGGAEPDKPVAAVTAVGAIPSGETFGRPSVLGGTLAAQVAFQHDAFQADDTNRPLVTISGVGAIGSAESFGAAKVRFTSGVGAISTGEAFGTTNFRRMLDPTGFSEQGSQFVGLLDLTGSTTLVGVPELRPAAGDAFQTDAFQS